MLGWQQKSFDLAFQIGADGISEYTMDQIKAKSAVMGLNDELTAQALALASDADFTAKASAKKITYKDAVDKYLDDNYDAIGEALKNNKKLKQSTVDALESAAKEGVDKYKETIKNVVNYTGDIADGIDIADDIVDIGSSASSATSGVAGLGVAFKGVAATLKPLLPILGAVAVGMAAFKGFQWLDDTFTLTYGTATEHLEEAASSYSISKAELNDINSELSETSSRISELQNKGTLTLTEQAELEKLQQQNVLLERQKELKEQVVSAAQKDAAEAAAEKLNFKSEESYYTDANGNLKTSPHGDVMSKSVTRIDKVKEELKDLESVQKQYDKIQKQIEDGVDEHGDKLTKAQKKSLKERADGYSSQINDYRSSISKMMEDINADAASLYDQETGAVISGHGKLAKTIESLNDDVLDAVGGKTQAMADSLSEIWKNNDFASAQQKLVNDLRMGKDVSVDDITKQFPDLVAACDEAGISVETLRNELVALAAQDTGLTQIESDFQRFQTNAVAAINAVDAINSAMVGSFSGKGLGISIDEETGSLEGDLINIQNAYKSLEGYDPSVLFEKTANGIHLNREALRALQAQQEALQKQDFINQQRTAQERLNQAIADQLEARNKYGDASQEYKNASLIVSDIQSQIETIQQLSAAYDGATSAYQKWINSQSNGEEGDMYRTVSETMKERGAALYKEGRYNTEEFRSIAQYWSDEDISTASMDQVVEAYEKASKARDRYFTGNKAGIDNFIYDVQQKFPEMMQTITDETGKEKIKFNIDDEKLANDLNVSKEAIQAIIRAASEYTDDIVIGDTSAIDNTTTSLQEMQNKAEEAKEKLQELSDAGKSDLAIDFNFDSTDLDDINNQIERAKQNLEQFRGKNGNIDLSVDGAEEAVVILQTLLKQKQAVSQPAIMEVDTSSLKGDVQTAIQALQDYQSAVNNLEYLNEQKKIGISIDDSSIEQAKQSIDEAYQKIESLGGEDKQIEIGANLKIDTSSKESVQDAISSIGTPEIKANIVANTNVDTSNLSVGSLKAEDSNAKVNYTLGKQDPPKDKTANVTYKNAGDEQAQPKAKNATVNYSKLGTQVAPKIKTAQVNYKKGKQENPSKKTAVVDYKKGKQANPTSPKTATVNYKLGSVAKPPSVTVKVNYDTSASPKYTGTMLVPAHVSGTAYNVRNMMPAYSDGKVSLARNERALVNELGTESIIRDGKWMLLPGGMHIASLKKGDIVLSATQTASLLNNGKANGHARAYAEGSLLSAFSSGSWIFGNTGGGNTGGNGTTKTPSYSSTAPKKTRQASSNSNSPSSASASSSSSKNEFKEIIDHVETYLKRANELTEKLVNAIDVANSLADKQAANSKALSQISNEINANQQAYNKYISQANSVGLSDNYKKQIQNGSLNIETITDEGLKDKIDQYREYYEKALDAEKTILDLQKQQQELALERLEYIESYYDKLVNVNDTLQELNNERITLNENIGASQASDYVKDLLRDSINAEQNKYNDLVQQLADYTSEFNSLVDKGYISKDSEAYLEGQATINEFNKAVIESSNALIELQDQLRELNYTKLQQAIDALERSAQRLENSTNYTESKGEDVSESDLQKQIDNANQQIQANYDKRNALLEEQALYDVGSKRYQEIADEIADLDDSIYDSLENIEDLKNQIWEIRWEPFFDGQKALSDLITETDDLRNLLNDDAFIGKNGGLTSEGIANIALISQGMNAAKQQIRDYQEALKKLDEDLQNGNISTSEYEEQQSEFLSSIRDSVAVVEDYKDEIVDLWKAQLEAENDVIQDSIDKHKELLQAKKDNDSYARNVRNQTKDINAIQAQISALSGIHNQSALAEKKRLEAQLAEMQDELDQTRKDREYEVRQAGYDGLSDDLNQALQDTLDEVTYNADKQEQVISEMLNRVVDQYQTAYGKIQDIIANTGFTPSGGMSSNIGNLGTASGAQDQVNDSNTIAPDYNPSDFSSGINTGSIQSSGSQSNNDNIENIISQEPNTTNRPVAELKLTTTSLSLQEGQSGSVKYSIRPTDAANKKLDWKSSNTSVATVSNGTVRAVKPGTATITAITTDGSALSASCGVTVTKKPDPPKPKPPVTNNKNQGDGVPRIGDKVKFESGKYYNDSYGTRPTGNKHQGEYLYITYMNSKAPYSIHLGTKPQPGYYSDLGWVKLNQISGYKDGTLGVSEDQFAKINELGKELIIRRGGSDHTWLQHGDGVVPADLTRNLFTLGKNADSIMKNIANSTSNRNSQSMVFNNHYDSLLTVYGSIDKEALPKLEEILKKSYDYTMQQAYKDAGKIGIKKSI